jgi:RNA polymerase sigma-70 factor (ECF subfamily)
MACSRGDAQALAIFEREVMPIIRQALSRAAITPTERADLEQELREDLLVGGKDRRPGIARFEGRASMKSWVRVAASRAVLKASMQGNRERPQRSGFFEMVDNGRTTPELRLWKAQYTKAFRRVFPQAIAALGRKERALLRYRYVENISVESIAGLYGFSRATAARHVKDAERHLLQLVRDRLKQELGVTDSDLPRLVSILQSRLELSLPRLLATTTD